MTSDPLKLTRSWASQAGRYFLRPVQIIRTYRREYVAPDILGGLTLAIVLLPHAIACALIADLPPAVGLYTAIFGGIVGALWGSSIPLNTGPTNAAALLMFSVLQAHVTSNSADFLPMVGVLAVMVGVARLLLGIARLGVLVNFVSDAVVGGFTLGIGLLIAINQLPAFFGVSVSTTDGSVATVLGIGAVCPTPIGRVL
jgi:SulP family sulfate permease